MSVVLLLGLSQHFAMADQERGLKRIAGDASGDKTQPAPSLKRGVYRAIVIGNNDYRDPKKIWRPLKTAINDAKEFARLLQQDYGFSDIDLLQNATRQQILQAINNMQEKTKPEDNVLVYYAGHGWRNDSTQEAYWIPVDAEGKDDSFYLSNVRIKEKLSVIAATASHTLLISDSCFSGSLLDSRGIPEFPDNGDDDAYFRKMSQRRSVQIIAAGGTEYVDDNYRQSGHSPFTYFLINELKLNDQRYLALSSLALKIEELVSVNAQQTPQSGAIRMAGDEGGQFIFLRVTDNTSSLPSQPSPKVARLMKTRPRSKLLAAIKTPASDNSASLSDDSEDLPPQQDAATFSPSQQGLPQGLQQQPVLGLLKAQDANDEIEELFEKASHDISLQRFSMPKGNSALDRYLTVLVLDANNGRAKSAIHRLFRETTRTVEHHISEHQMAQAKKFLFQAERIDPDNQDNMRVIDDLRNQIDAAGYQDPNNIDNGINVIHR